MFIGKNTNVFAKGKMGGLMDQFYVDNCSGVRIYQRGNSQSPLALNMLEEKFKHFPPQWM
jgi:hypothetical protein